MVLFYLQTGPNLLKISPTMPSSDNDITSKTEGDTSISRFYVFIFLFYYIIIIIIIKTIIIITIVITVVVVIIIIIMIM